jgi:hypothetical protein
MNTDKKDRVRKIAHPSDNRMVPNTVGRTPWSAPAPPVGLPARRAFMLYGWPGPAMQGSSAAQNVFADFLRRHAIIEP